MLNFIPERSLKNLHAYEEHESFWLMVDIFIVNELNKKCA